MNILSRGLRNAFRNTVRSVSIIVILGLAIGLSLVMLIARQAVASKIDSVNSSIGNTVTISPAGFNNFSTVNNTLTTTELKKVASLNHVTGLTESLTERLTTIGSSTPAFGANSSTATNNQTTLTSPVTINNSRFVGGGGFGLPANFSLPITIIGTDTPNSVNDSNLSLSSGQFISGNSANNEALISNSMASKNNLKLGSTFTAYSSTLTVSGIFTSPKNSGLAGDVIVSLPTEQSISGQSGDVTSAIATVDSLTNLAVATSEIKNDLGSSADVTSSIQQAQDTTAPLNNIKTITLYSLIGAIIAGSIIIFLIMIMIVRERRREIGVLKAIGASNLTIIGQFMVEAITLTLAGAVIGVLIGVAASSPITHLLVNNASSAGISTVSRGHFGGGGFGGIVSGNGNFAFHESNRGAFRGIKNSFSNIQAVVGWSIIIYGVAAALVIALIGSIAASFMISKIRPAEVMRVE